MSLSRRTLKGMMWAYGAFFSSRIFTLISTAILARVLIPADFGLIGFALVVLSFAEVLRNLGINEAQIYEDEHPDETADTAFWINAAVGVVQFSAIFLLAPLAVNLFDDTRTVDVVRAMALGFVIDGFGLTHSTMLQKELMFRQRFLPELISALVKGILSVVLAFGGFGVWSLVAGHVVGAVMRTVFAWLLVSWWRPRFRFFLDRARRLWNYGVHIFLFNLISVALDQADQTVIALVIGQVQLGYYAIASRIPELIIANFSLILTRVLFPVFVKIKDDRERLIRSFLTTTRYTAFATFPAGFGLVAVAPELMRVVYGEQWEAAIPLFQVLALLGVVFAMPWAAGDVLKAIGRPDISTKLLVIESLYTFPLIWAVGAQTGQAVAASSANLVAALIAVVVRLVLISRLLKFSPSAFVRVFGAPLLGGVGILVTVEIWRRLVGTWPDVAVLGSAVLLGTAAYGAILLLLERAEVADAWYLIQGVIRRRAAEN